MAWTSALLHYVDIDAIPPSTNHPLPNSYYLIIIVKTLHRSNIRTYPNDQIVHARKNCYVFYGNHTHHMWTGTLVVQTLIQSKNDRLLRPFPTLVTRARRCVSAIASGNVNASFVHRFFPSSDSCMTSTWPFLDAAYLQGNIFSHRRLFQYGEECQSPGKSKQQSPSRQTLSRERNLVREIGSRCLLWYFIYVTCQVV